MRDVRNPDFRIPDEHMSIVSLTARLFRELSVISVQEHPRDASSRVTLADILGINLMTLVNNDRIVPDYMHPQGVEFNDAQDVRRQVTAAPVIVEVKSELGAGGDPSVQVSFSFSRFYCQETVSCVVTINCPPC